MLFYIHSPYIPGVSFPMIGLEPHFHGWYPPELITRLIFLETN